MSSKIIHNWSDNKFALNMYKNKIEPKVGDILYDQKIIKILMFPRNKHRLNYGNVTIENGDVYSLRLSGWIRLEKY